MHIEEKHSISHLLLKVTEGDEQALAAIVRLYWKNIYGHALAWIRSAEEAEELTQDIFLKVWNSRSQLGEVENFENWLFIISRNTILSAVRKKLNRPSFVEQQEQEENSLRPDQWSEHRQH